MSRYIFAVICAALISGILQSLTGEGAAKALVKFLCGIFMTLTVLAPLRAVDLDRLPALSISGLDKGEDLAEQGKNMSRQAVSEYIKQRTESYILDKAGSLNAEVIVTVTVSGDDPPAPTAVDLAGRVSPYAKKLLEEMIQTDLGIPKENLRWTG